MRGFLTRKRIRGFQMRAGGMQPDEYDGDMPLDYDNPKVQVSLSLISNRFLSMVISKSEMNSASLIMMKNQTTETTQLNTDLLSSWRITHVTMENGRYHNWFILTPFA